ncbi:hypothetical protein AMS68_007102 [Peltaster fructicola]|uniref:Uncharacterized protein n=1 Tax=Peltaster fructicola TaxID=286661 RepID=A0A6H0Y3T0_9PEZI|nr:hypothetical protein AMS68_007102 [Peltaster fructicola]
MAAVVAAKEVAAKSTKLQVLIDTLNYWSRPARIDQHVRKAVEQGQLDDVITCIHQPKRSTISIASQGVLKHTLRGLRTYPQRQKWSETSVNKALERSRTIATLLQAQQQDRKSKPIKADTESPELLGTYLELAAVNAYKHQDGKDVDRKVESAAARLLSGFEREGHWMKVEWQAPEAGQVDVVLEHVPAWHGLSLAQKILGKQMPQPELARNVIATYDTGLRQVIDQVKAKQPKEGSYGFEAVRAYDDCIRD